MKLTLDEPKYLKDSISIISELVSEGRFKVTPDAIELVAMDPANVAMVIFKLLSSTFKEYKVDQQTEIAIHLPNLKQVLRRVGANDVITLEMEGESKLKMLITGKSKRTFYLPIIALDEKEQRVPELTFPSKITLPSQVLTDAVEDVDIISESVTFSVEPKKFGISAEGDLNQVDIEIKDGDDIKIDCTAKEAVKAKYSIEYLKKMVGGAKLADKVSVQFNKDYPLKLDFTSVDKVQLSFILAPRVEND